MHLNEKIVMPKVQMLVNGFLSQIEQTQLNFSHEEYSIQVKNANLLTINFYEPEMQDIQWSLQFLGIRTIKHVCVSFDRRKRIRLVIYTKNNIHFLQGQIKKHESVFTFREMFIKSQRILPLKLKNTDDVLFISGDLFPDHKTGIFLICTVSNLFYVLRANHNRSELIDLNRGMQIPKIFSSLKSFLCSQSTEDGEQQSKTVRHLLIKLVEQNKNESFKAVILTDFDLSIRFVNVPWLQYGKNHSSIRTMSEMDLKLDIQAKIGNLQQLSTVSSSLFQLSYNQIVALFFLKDQQDMGKFIMLSQVINIQKSQSLSVSHTTLHLQQFHSVQFQKDQGAGLVTAMIRYENIVSLMKITVLNLQVVQSLQVADLGNTILSKSYESDKLILLSPYRIFDIGTINDSLQIRQQMEIQQSHENLVEQQVMRRQKGMKKLNNGIVFHQPYIRQNWRKHQYQKIVNTISIVELQIAQKLNYIDQNMSSEQEIISLLKLWTSFSFCSILISQQIKKSSKGLFQNPEFIKIVDQCLISENLDPLDRLFNLMMQNRLSAQFLNLWVQFLRNYRYMQFFQNEKVKKTEQSLLNQKFGHILNNFMQGFLKNQQIRNNSQDAILNLLKLSSGILVLQREVYRGLIQILNNSSVLKKIAIQQLNFSLLSLIYFQTNQLSLHQLKGKFADLRIQRNQGCIQDLIKALVQEYAGRYKAGKVQGKGKKFAQILSVFNQYQSLIYDQLYAAKSNLFILLGLKLGRRQDVAVHILEATKDIRHEQNQLKLFLSLPQDYNEFVSQRMQDIYAKQQINQKDD